MGTLDYTVISSKPYSSIAARISLTFDVQVQAILPLFHLQREAPPKLKLSNGPIKKLVEVSLC